VVHSYNPSTGRLRQEFQVSVRAGLHGKFQASIGYTVRPCLKNKQTNKQTKTHKTKTQKQNKTFSAKTLA
jgi:hypothetical protein